MKIVFFEIEKWEKEVFKKHLPRDKLLFSKEKLTLKNVSKYKNAEVISVFVFSEVNEKVLQQLPELKLITTMSTGFDHIHLETCRKRKITVCNVPSYGENTVAEHTFALILGLSRKLVGCVERTKKGKFDRTGLRGVDLMGKTLGVVGGGNIGQHVIRMAKGFEMNVLVFDIKKNKTLAKKLGFRYVNLNSLLKRSDIVTLHLPLNKHTHHLIDKKKINLMKKGAYLINTSRGEIVDTDALVKALKKKRLAGAGLDVLENEGDLIESSHSTGVLTSGSQTSFIRESKYSAPTNNERPNRRKHATGLLTSGGRGYFDEPQLLKKNFKCDQKILAENRLLLKMPNVLITPHNAFNTEEALGRILKTTVESIKKFKKGKKVNVV